MILPLLFHDDQHSLFFLHSNKTRLTEMMNSMNTRRIAAAEQYFSQLNVSRRPTQRYEMRDNIASADTVTVALTIITVSRNRHEIDRYEPKYLTQTVWKFHSLLQNRWLEHHKVSIHMSVCNVDSRAASYNEAHTLSTFVPIFSRFNDTHFSLVHPLEKEKQDYVFCLNKSLTVQKSADYIFLVEDDAFPTDDVFDVLCHVLLMHTEHSFVRGEFDAKPSDVAFVKFYHPERLLNFVSLQPERLPELFAYAAVLSTVLIVVYTVICQISVACSDAVAVNAWWMQLFIFSVVVLLACGRPGISAWRHVASPLFYSYTPAPSCCTPALLFPRPSAMLTVSYLSNNTCGANIGKDSLLDQMLHSLQLRAFLVQPNTFSHIGVYSSLRLRIVDPFLV